MVIHEKNNNIDPIPSMISCSVGSTYFIVKEEVHSATILSRFLNRLSTELKLWWFQDSRDKTRLTGREEEEGNSARKKETWICNLERADSPLC